MKLVLFHRDARAELVDACRFYESRSPGLGVALVDEVERAVARVVTLPEASPLAGKRVRKKALWRFP